MSYRKMATAVAVMAGLAGVPGTLSAAQAGVLGSDSAACTSGEGPAIRANVEGLKDRTGELKLELYPANDEDFTKDDRDLIKEGKFFRRIRVPTPQTGPISLCIKVPAPGKYALLFTHNRDGRNKFDPFMDGAGVPSNIRLGRSRPKAAMATVDVHGVVTTDIRAQYLRGFSGFGPLKG